MRIGPDPVRVKAYVTLMTSTRGRVVTSEKPRHGFRVNFRVEGLDSRSGPLAFTYPHMNAKIRKKSPLIIPDFPLEFVDELRELV